MEKSFDSKPRTDGPSTGPMAGDAQGPVRGDLGPRGASGRAAEQPREVSQVPSDYLLRALFDETFLP